MEYYNLIREPEETKKFLSLLPDIELNECVTVALFVRKKYLKDRPEMAHLSIDNNDGCYDRSIISKTKKDKDNNFNAKLYRSILKYNAPIGAYVDRIDQELPEDLLSLYMSINPRCAIKATKELITDLTEECFLQTHKEVYVGNIVSRAKTMVQKYASRKLIADIDIDEKDEDIMDAFRDYVRGYNAEVATVETRGGWHVLVDIKAMAEKNKDWYRGIKALCDGFNEDCDKDIVEFKTDTLCPIVGTMQGGFLVRLVD